MTKGARTVAKLEIAKGRIQPALRLLCELRQAIGDDAPIADQLELIDQATNELLRLEDAVGCVTPAALFE